MSETSKLKLIFILGVLAAPLLDQTEYALALIVIIISLFGAKLMMRAMLNKINYILFPSFAISAINGDVGKDYLRDVLYISASFFIYTLGSYFGSKIAPDKILIEIYNITKKLSATFIAIFVIYVFLMGGDPFALSRVLLRDILPISIYLTIYLNNSKVMTPSPLSKIMLWMCLIISNSRTLIGNAILLILSGFSNNKKLYFLIFSIVLIFLFAFVYGGSGKFDLLYKISNSVKEVTIENYDNIEDISLNWRGYESFLALQQFSNNSTFNQIFGEGFGARISLGMTMELAGTEYESIPVMHNGLLYILIKEGLFGVTSYILFIFLLYIKLKRKYKSKIIDINTFKFARGLLLCVIMNIFFVGGFMQTGSLIFIFLLAFLVNIQLNKFKIWNFF